ncbi:MAG: hypothetical protein R3B49_03115 [Phycisphaerales bacterium]
MKIVPYDASTGWRTGTPSIDGNRMVIGAYGATVGTTNDAGKLYVYERDGTGWTLVQEITQDPPTSVDGFPGQPVVYADTIFAGARTSSQGQGQVYVYQYNGTEFELAQILTADDGTDRDGFGATVIPTPDTLYVSGGGVAHINSVYIFEKVAGLWTQTGTLEPTNGQMGGALVVKGDVMVGAAFPEDAVHVFERIGGVWTERDTIYPPYTPPAGHPISFGIGLDLQGDTLAVGARNAEINGNANGAVYIYQRTANGWDYVQLVRANDGVPTDRFGCAVSISGTRLAVGAMEEAGTPAINDSGSIYIFEYDGVMWQQAVKLRPQLPSEDATFGEAVCLLTPDELLTSASGDSEAAMDAGAGYIFDFTELTCSIADLDASGALNLDDVNLFAGAFVSGDLLADLDDSGTLNLDDVNLFAQAFIAGCP